LQTIILNLNHYDWFVSKIGYIDFVPLSMFCALNFDDRRCVEGCVVVV